MATTLKFLILGDDQASRSFNRFAKSIDNANQRIARNSTALKQQSKASAEAQGGVLKFAGTLTGLGDAEDLAAGKGSTLQKVISGVGLATGLAEPAVSALAVAAGGLAAAGVSAAAGLGVFGLVAKAEFGTASTAAKAYAKAQAQLAGAKTPAARAAAIAAEAAATKGLTSAQLGLVGAITRAQSQWSGFLKIASPGADAVLAKGIGLLPRVLQLIEPLLKPVEQALTGLLTQLSSALWSSGADRLSKMLAGSAGQAIAGFGEAIGNVAVGLGGILRAFMPFQATVIGGIDTITGKFATWASDLGTHSGFQAMVSQWKTNWPLMKTGLGSMLTIVTNIGRSMASMTTGSNSKALWNLANPILALAAKLSSSPQLVEALLYLSLVGKGAKQIGGVFNSMKTGWGALSKVTSALTGGKISLGVQSAGDTMLVASKNMQKAADTMAGAGLKGGGVKAGEGAAATAGAGMTWKAPTALSGLTVPLAAGGAAIAGGFFASVATAISAGRKGDWQKVSSAISGAFQGPSGILQMSANGITQAILSKGGPLTSIPVAGPIIASLQSEFGKVTGAISRFTGPVWSAMATFAKLSLAGFLSGLQAGWGAVAGWFSGPFVRFFTGTVPALGGGALNWLLAAGRSALAGLLHGVTAGWGAVASWLGGIPGRVGGYAAGAAGWLLAGGKNVIKGLSNGIASAWTAVEGWFRGLPSKILSALGIHSPPDWAISAGGHIMGGILQGLAHGSTNVQGFFTGLAKDVTGPLASVWSTISAAGGGAPGGAAIGAGAAAAQAYAKSILHDYGWGPTMFPPLQSLWNGESGWNYKAYNASSGATGIPQSLPGSKMASAGADWRTNPATQIRWGLGYIKGRYGSPATAYSDWLARSPHWYGAGTGGAAPGWGVVGERGRELVDFGRGGQTVLPNSMTNRVLSGSLALPGYAAGTLTPAQKLKNQRLAELAADVVRVGKLNKARDAVKLTRGNSVVAEELYVLKHPRDKNAPKKLKSMRKAFSAWEATTLRPISLLDNEINLLRVLTGHPAGVKYAGPPPPAPDTTSDDTSGDSTGGSSSPSGPAPGIPVTTQVDISGGPAAAARRAGRSRWGLAYAMGRNAPSGAGYAGWLASSPYFDGHGGPPAEPLAGIGLRSGYRAGQAGGPGGDYSAEMVDEIRGLRADHADMRRELVAAVGKVAPAVHTGISRQLNGMARR